MLNHQTIDFGLSSTSEYRLWTKFEVIFSVVPVISVIIISRLFTEKTDQSKYYLITSVDCILETVRLETY